MKGRFLKHITILVLVLTAVFSLISCGKLKKAEGEGSFSKLLSSYVGKDVTISMWDDEKSKAVKLTYTIAEVKADYIVVQEKAETGITSPQTQTTPAKKIAIPISNITHMVTSDIPPTIVLSDQILLTGLGETIDNIGYLGSRIERLERVTKPRTE